MPTTIAATDLRTHPNTAGIIYRAVGDFDPHIIGASITITGGTGWNPGTYTLGMARKITDFPEGTRIAYECAGAATAAGLSGGEATIPTSTLRLTANVGNVTADALGSTGARLIANGPTITGGEGTVHFQWYYAPLPTASSTPVAIVGQTGNNLLWEVPAELQNQVLGIFVEVFDDGDGAIHRIGNFTSPDFYIETRNAFAQAYAPPLPTPPTNAELIALLNQVNIPAGKMLDILMAGDSTTQGGAGPALQAIVDADATLAAKINVRNFGHDGTSPLSWGETYDFNAGSNDGKSREDGVDSLTLNNHAGYMGAIDTSVAAGNLTAAAIGLGTNSTPPVSPTFTTPYTALVNDAHTRGAGVVVLHDLMGELPSTNDIIDKHHVDWEAHFDTLIAANSSWTKAGSQNTVSDHLQRREFQTDALHANEVGGTLQDWIARRNLAAILVATAEVYPASTGGEVIPTAATPTFSPAAGTYSGGRTVNFASSTPGVTFHYTVDGSAPTTASPSGSSVYVGSSKTVKVLAVKSGFTNSAVASAAYVINAITTPAILAGVTGVTLAGRRNSRRGGRY